MSTLSTLRFEAGTLPSREEVARQQLAREPMGRDEFPKETRRTGCPFHDVRSKLKEVGLRPTRQRMALGWLLFQKGDRHLTAELLHDEATRARVPVSLATVYNTLHQFTEVGLLREFAVDGSKTYFDTNVDDHHHYFVEGENAVLDIPGEEFALENLPAPPEGFEVARVDVIVRLRRKGD